jgi:hypothetical protein
MWGLGSWEPALGKRPVVSTSNTRISDIFYKGSSIYMVLVDAKKIFQFFADGVSIRKKQSGLQTLRVIKTKQFSK